MNGKRIISVFTALSLALTLVGVNPAFAQTRDAPPAAPDIPGYIQYTDSSLDPSLSYLIVTADSKDDAYALYASQLGTTVGSGSLSKAKGTACTAALAMSDNSVAASYLRDSAPLDMSSLQFTAAAVDGGGYTLRSNGYYLSLGTNMFSTTSTALTVSNQGGQYRISAAERLLNFNKVGDAASAYPAEKYITDFWGPSGSYNFPIYLYVDENAGWVPPAPEPPEYAEGTLAGGTTSGQPFASGTGGSTNFRIPALVTLKDGSLLAAADARWDHAGDACALDTIVSRSTDNGETWNYSFPNFFNDSTNAKDAHATAFIDPVMTVGQDGTVYLLVDLFPGGIGLNTAPAAPAASTGYAEIDGEMRLVLYRSTNGQTDENYSYYVGAFDNTYAPVYSKDNGNAPVYYVDSHYNLYNASKEAKYCQQLGSNKLVQQNVFYYYADLHVRNATYLWLLTSSDNGETWSAPAILNPQIRKTSGTNQFYGVGPGAGLCLEDGTIIFPCYTFTSKTINSSQIASFIYSSDGGQTWSRSDDATTGGHWSSESALVQLDAATIRHFYRDGYSTLYYTDHTWVPEQNKWVAGTPVDTGVTKTYNNQLSAIRYSKDIDGKPAIMVSTAASGTGSRVQGRLYTFLLNDDNSMELAYTYAVTDGNYGYSSLTELPDGSIGLLYEAATIEYHHFSILEVVAGATVEGMPTVILTAASNELKAGTTAALTAQVSNADAADLVWTSGNEAVATVAGSGSSATVTALKAGKALITAALTVEGRVYSASVKFYISDEETITLPDEFEDTLSTKNNCYLLDADGIDSGSDYSVLWPGSSEQVPRILYHASGSANTDQVGGTVTGPILTLASGFDASRQLWTIQAVEGGYTLKSVDSNQYLSITGASASKLPTSQTGVLFSITPNGDGLYNIGTDVSGTMYYIHHNNSAEQFNAAAEPTGLALYRHVDAVFTTSTARLSALITKIEGESLNASDYSSASWSALTGALAAAKALAANDALITAVEADAIALQSRIVSSAQALYAARKGLVAPTTPDPTPDPGWSGSGSSTTTDTTKNPDGSTTTTVTNKTTGTVTQTTKGTDGTVTVLETKKDGTSTAKEQRPDGSHGISAISVDGTVKAEATVSASAIKAAEAEGKTIVLPVSGIKSGSAAVVGVTLSTTGTAVKVEIPVAAVTPGTVLVLVKEDGSEEIIKTTALTQAGVAITLSGSATLKVVDNSKSFADTAKVGSWAGDAISFVSARGLFGGVGGDNFAPNGTMDRATLATVLYRLENEPRSTDTLDAFADGSAVPAWSADAMAWGVESGIINGDGSTLQPTAAISREQLIAILYRYSGSPAAAGTMLAGYTDGAQVSGWAHDATEWALEQGLLTGKGGGTLDPTAAITRAEFSAILMRYINQK